MGGVTCLHCGQPLQERWFWAHESDTTYIQGVPVTNGEAPGRTLWVTSPLLHEPEPKPQSKPVEVTPEELAEMRATIAKLKKQQEGE